MSNALAIAGVTAVLKDLLDTGVIEHRLVDALGAGVTVSSMMPRDVPLTGVEGKPRLNLFLHQLTHNAAWRNVDLPSRNARGERSSNPPLALNLHYLLSAYGFAELQAEVLLGYAMQLLHEHPVIGRREIRAALNPAPGGVALLPSVWQSLTHADLAEQVELLKIVPDALGGEELSRLWSAMQAPYRPSATFQVSVVLIEPTRPARSPLPVLKRGAQDQGALVTPDTVLPLPTLETLIAPAHRTSSVLRIGDAAVLGGHHLAGTQRTLALLNDRFGLRVEIALPDGLSADDERRIAFTLPAAPADLPAGLWRAELGVLRAGESTPRVSNALPFAIAPAFTLPPLALARDANNTVSITLACTPALRAGQAVALLLDNREVTAKSFAAGASQVSFDVAAAPPAGTQPLLRLRVEGVESIAIDRNAVPPAFLPLRVTLPA